MTGMHIASAKCKGPIGFLPVGLSLASRTPGGGTGRVPAEDMLNGMVT